MSKSDKAVWALAVIVWIAVFATAWSLKR